MADWVHCNSCYDLPGSSGKKFSLTSCGHIYCFSCLEPGSNQKCSVCGAQCSSMVLSSKMKPEVEMYFMDLNDLVKKTQRQVVQVLDFQSFHRHHLTSFRKDKCMKFSDMMKHVKAIESEMKILKDENTYLKKLMVGNQSGGRHMVSPSSGRRQVSPVPAKTPPSGYVGLQSNRGTPGQRGHSRENSPYPMSQSYYNKALLGKTRLSVISPPINGKIGTIAASKMAMQYPQDNTRGHHHQDPLNQSIRSSKDSPMAQSPTPSCSSGRASSYGFPHGSQNHHGNSKNAMTPNFVIYTKPITPSSSHTRPVFTTPTLSMPNISGYHGNTPGSTSGHSKIQLP